VIGFTTAPGLSKVWYTELRPYVGKDDTERAGNVSVFVSPNDPTLGGLTGSNAVAADAFNRRSYAINYYDREYVLGSGTVYRGRRMVTMPPTTTIFIGNYPAVAMNTHGISPNSEASLAGIPRNWHSIKGVAQFSFLDGHVEMVAVNDLMTNGARYTNAWGTPAPAVPQ